LISGQDMKPPAREVKAKAHAGYKGVGANRVSGAAGST
jgi:hypothetical protein